MKEFEVKVIEGDIPQDGRSRNSKWNVRVAAVRSANGKWCVIDEYPGTKTAITTACTLRSRFSDCDFVARGSVLYARLKVDPPEQPSET
jgi:hypothetical protein